MDESGLKLTYISDNQKMLNVKCSKNSQCYSEEKKKLDNSGLHEYKWKQFDSLNGSV
jgi:hypothetical protein